MSTMNTEEPLKIVTEGEYRGVGIEVDVVSIPFLDDVDEDGVRGVFAVNSTYIAVNQDDQRFEVSLDMDGQSVNVIHIPEHIDVLTVKRWNQGGSGEFVSVEGGLDKYRNGTQVYSFVEHAIKGDSPDHHVSVFNEGGSGKFSTIEGLNGFRDGSHLYVNKQLEPNLNYGREIDAKDAATQRIQDKTQAVQKYFDQLSGRMMAERAKDLSDAEINRTLGATVLPKFCIDAITHLRDHDGLTIDKVYGSWATMANRFYESAVESTLYTHTNVDDISTLPFNKLNSPHLVTGYRELISSGNEINEKEWEKFVELHVQREVTPDKFYALMEESSSLEIEIAKGQDTPQVDARLAEIDVILNNSGLEYDMDKGRVYAIDIHSLMIEKGVPFSDSDVDGKLHIEYLNYPITSTTTEDEMKNIAERISEKYFDGNKKYFRAVENHILESKMLIENTEKTLGFLKSMGTSVTHDELIEKALRLKPNQLVIGELKDSNNMSPVAAKDAELSLKIMSLRAAVETSPDNEIVKEKLANARTEYAGFLQELDDSVLNFHRYQKEAETSNERYMVLSITNTENAAFIDVGREEEVARILRDTANNLPNVTTQQGNALVELPLRDLNGNTVGELKIVSKNEDQYGFRIIGSKFEEQLDGGTLRLVAALQNDDLLESAASVLVTAADKFSGGDKEFNLRDINGNTIGKFAYQEPQSLLNDNVIDIKAALDNGSIYLGDDSVSDYTSEGFRFVVTGGDYELGYHEEPEETVVVNAQGEIAPDDGNYDIREVNLSKLDRAMVASLRDVSEGNMTLEAFEKKHYPTDDDEYSM